MLQSALLLVGIVSRHSQQLKGVAKTAVCLASKVTFQLQLRSTAAPLPLMIVLDLSGTFIDGAGRASGRIAAPAASSHGCAALGWPAGHIEEGMVCPGSPQTGQVFDAGPQVCGSALPAVGGFEVVSCTCWQGRHRSDEGRPSSIVDYRQQCCCVAAAHVCEVPHVPCMSWIGLVMYYQQC